MNDTKQIDDGRPAFPGTEANGLNSGVHGMSLRDAFAIAALSFYGPVVAEKVRIAIREGGSIDFPKEKIASIAYSLADAMLAAREVKKA